MRRRFDLKAPEITLEANPDDVTETLADAWRATGVNRVSLGVQSFDDAALRYLGRRHDAETARRACRTVAARFANWSMDLIYGAHPPASWPATLTECVSFAAPHVSCYGLTYEPDTPFGREPAKPSTKTPRWRVTGGAANSWPDTNAMRFRISPCRASGAATISTIGATSSTRGSARGLSFIDGGRSMNETALEAYLARPGRKAERLRLSEREIRVETLIQHFRLSEGWAATRMRTGSGGSWGRISARCSGL